MNDTLVNLFYTVASIIILVGSLVMLVRACVFDDNSLGTGGRHSGRKV
jgi:hypothetical protein